MEASTMKKTVRLALLTAAVVFAFCSVQGAEVTEKDDFYQAVNGQTLAEKQIKPTEPSWSWFSEQSQKNIKTLEADMKEIVAKEGTYAPGTAEQKIADLYRCASDMDRRNATARHHIQAVLKPVEQAATTAELTQALCRIHDEYGADVFVTYTADRRPDSSVYAARIVPAETMLSRAELENEPQPGAWQRYKQYIADVLKEAGQPEEKAQQQAAAIFAMEQQWAPAMLTSEERNDVTVYNRMSRRSQVEQILANMNGPLLFSAWGLDREEEVFLSNEAYLRRMDESYTPEHIELLKSYATFRIMNSYAPYADAVLRDLQRQYIQQRFGIRQSRSDEETASRLTQSLLPYEFGQIYAEKHLSPETVQDVRAMIDEIRGVYKKRLLANTWLSKETRKKAVEKIDSLRVFVGGPAADDRPLIETMPVVTAEKDGGDLLSNVIQSSVAVQQQVHALLGTHFNPDKWYAFQPQDVNAAYIPENNSITIPAGILNSPFYQQGAPAGTNLGGIGVVIGHEISHAFDPNGSQYDKNGMMKNWWKRSDYEAFQQKAAAFGTYYDQYEVGPGLYENGRLVTNEAIADCGGLSVVTEIAGADTEALRRLYRNFAVIFAEKMTPQLLLQIVQNDPHPVSPARVNAALSSTDGFYAAYDIQPGDGMYTEEKGRVKLW